MFLVASCVGGRACACPFPPRVRASCAAYLVAYNVASAVGWALILKLVVEAWLAGDSPAALYGKVGLLLQVVQSAAALEVVHALVGLVRSPVGTTALQVASRLMLVWAYTVPHADCHAHWSLFLMVGRCVVPHNSNNVCVRGWVGAHFVVLCASLRWFLRLSPVR